MMLKLKVGAYIVAAMLLCVLTWKICSWRNDSQYKAVVKQLQVAQQKNQILANQNVEEQAKYQKQIGELNGKVRVEIKQVPVYGECTVPDSGVQLRADTVNAANKVTSTC